ncbi:Gfo/Idh/MocA family oxidoreductase [Paraburkholderia sp. MPAMCS5]|uniref:Gfo/Idh/MocA family protein n=1 Tax=Paraburkholderia sp. MPAMCS5 TaxID=3112563 RepID=UPI002E181DA9|nr:Gfo/Idh/MocA family oxidoreductase [Paraburkholderia sp. MPAMCS5]
MRIALIGPSHWHYSMYQPGLASDGFEIVGVADSILPIAQSVAAHWACPYWTDYRRMLDQANPDFVFAFGQHSLMPAIAVELIQRAIPFSIEKPCGTSVDDVRSVAEAAEKAKAFVSVPFHYRLSAMRAALSSAVALPSSGFREVRFRIIAGSPLRFRDSSAWLVDPQAAGGGCMMNLAHHAIDFLVDITGEAIEEVQATVSNASLNLPIEDFATLSVRTNGGTVGVIETGYTHPADSSTYMEFDVELVHQRFIVKKEGASMLVTAGAERRQIPTNWQFKDYFSDYAVDAVRRCATGRSPIATLHDLETTMTVVQAGYRSAREKRRIRLTEDRVQKHDTLKHIVP